MRKETNSIEIIDFNEKLANYNEIIKLMMYNERKYQLVENDNQELESTNTEVQLTNFSEFW